jgi:3-methylcrotonyl-CoA carboxylase beta subunit
MTEGSGLYLAGPALVKAAIGQRISSEELGGAEVHASISGTIDFKEKDDPSCIARIRYLVDQMGVRPRAPFDRTDVSEPLYDPGEVYGIFADNPQDEYDTREILARIVDHSAFTEYKAEYGKTVITAYARVGGFAVGIVANQKMHVRQKGKKFEFGGVIYTESANKAARFVMDCNQNLIPLVFLHDVNGFMVGREAEHGGIIKAGARLVNVVSNSVVPKITVIMGGSFGAGHYAMCGKAYSPRFIYAWPTARYAVMGGDQAAGTLVDIKLKQLERSGQVLGEDEKRELFESVKRTYDHQTDPRYGAARLWVDKIIDPAQTRATLIRSLELTSLNPEIPKFNVGVLQT